MSRLLTRHPADDLAARPCPVLPSYEADEATLRAAVEQGQASARAGRLVTLDQVEAELRQIIHGRGRSS